MRNLLCCERLLYKVCALAGTFTLFFQQIHPIVICANVPCRRRLHDGGTVANKPYAQVSAFQSGQSSVKTWLITPGIDLVGKTNPRLTFINADGYDKGATLKLFISSDYAGGSPLTATWTQLNANISTGHTNGYGPFISSGEIDLSSYINQTVYLAFKYEGADASSDHRTTTYEIDNIYVVAD